MVPIRLHPNLYRQDPAPSEVVRERRSSGLEVTVGGTARTYGPSSGINIRLRHPALVGGTVQADFSFQ